MRLVRALRAVEKTSKASAFVTNDKYPDIRLCINFQGNWVAWRGKEQVEFAFCTEDLNDYGWKVTYM